MLKSYPQTSDHDLKNFSKPPATRYPDELYVFGDFVLNAPERCLLYKGALVSLTPKALETLIVLVRNANHVVTKNQLLDEVWQDTYVEEATVTQNVSTVRKILASYCGDVQFIETIPKRGYRFVTNLLDTSSSAAKNLTSDRLAEVSQDDTLRPSEFRQNGAAAAAEAGTQNGFSPALRSVAASQSPKNLSGKYARVVLLGVLLVAVGAGTAWIARTWRKSRTAASVPASFERMTLNRVTLSGDARFAVVSPDGKYVTYITTDGGKQAIWLKQNSSASSTPLVPATDATLIGLSFTPDSGNVLFVRYEPGEIKGILYKIAIIGGPPKRVIEDIDSSVSFSPAGDRFVFVRGYPAVRQSALLVANADGSGEQQIAVKTFPAFFSTAGPTWSPDGKVIACGFRGDDEKGVFETVVAIDTSNWSQKQMTEQRWARVGRTAWAGTSNDLILTAASQQSSRQQIWRIAYPSGAVNKITNDLMDYRGVSLSDAGDLLTTVQSEVISNIEVSSFKEPERTSVVSSELSAGLGGASWAANGKIIFTSEADGNLDIWLMNADGSGKTQVTVNDRRDSTPTMTRDGAVVLFASSSQNSPTRIWRVKIDGTNPQQITNGNDDRNPDVSPDGKWVVYSSYDRDEQLKETLAEAVWKIPSEGGQPVRIAEQSSKFPLFSPDGKLLAILYQRAADAAWKIRIINFADGSIVKELPMNLASNALFRWTHDGEAITYVEDRNGVSNIWSQSIRGGSPSQVTHFSSGQIFRFNWSFDGKQLLCVRGNVNSNVVLVSNLR